MLSVSGIVKLSYSSFSIPRQALVAFLNARNCPVAVIYHKTFSACAYQQYFNQLLEPINCLPVDTDNRVAVYWTCANG
jgi:hypothetical protein